MDQIWIPFKEVRNGLMQPSQKNPQGSNIFHVRTILVSIKVSCH